MLPVGRISLVGRNLVIDCAPQIAGRLVRFFGGARRGEKAQVIISGTDKNVHELAVLRQLYPLEPDDAAAAHMARGAERYKAREAALEEMRAIGYTPPAFALAEPARPYQAEAADLCLRGSGLLVGDDVGLGKTITGIAAMLGTGALPALVITKTDVTDQWDRQVRRFAPGLRTHIITKAQPYPLADQQMTELNPETGRRRIVRNGAKRLPDVIIASYSKLDGWRDALADLHLGLVVWDECQELRTGDKSSKGSAARQIADSARYRMGLSATPIFNYGHEIFNVLSCIAPDVLGAEAEFRSEFCAGGNVISPRTLRSHLVERGAFIRRRRADVGRDLPPIERIWHTVTADTRRLRAIDDDVAELARKVLRVVEDGPMDRGEQWRAAGELDWRLRQATGLAKVGPTIDLLRMLLDEPDRQILLFGHHHLVFDAWAAGLERHGFKAARFTGRQSATEKREAVRAFTARQARVLMMANRAGAGIDGLQAVCSTTVVGELDWSPAVHWQGEGRTNRDGQPEPCAAFYVVTDDGSDPVIRDVLDLKETQRSGLADGDIESGSEEIFEGADGGRMRKLATAYLARREGK